MMEFPLFNEEIFRKQVNQALISVRTILDNTKDPQLPSDVHHEYEDKYILAEFLSNNAIAAHHCILECLGVNQHNLQQLQEWAKARSITLRLNVEETCKFSRSGRREVQNTNTMYFKEEFQSQPFRYAIRRPDHSPEGELSIVCKHQGEIAIPVSTFVSHSIAPEPWDFNITAATKITFMGDIYLHGLVSHQFVGESGSNIFLKTLARQFCSFILIVGRIVSANQLDPKHAIIIQNKDDLEIPLKLETIPTPKEFRDAIKSLSPEQQEFCRAYRNMQLESTLFGVAIIQIKPQLEKVLNLPYGSLIKEIQLTQDLLELFIKHQIPADLVSYDGAVDNFLSTKIDRVKELVKRMTSFLAESKIAELAPVAQPRKTLLRSNSLPIGPSIKSSPKLHRYSLLATTSPGLLLPPKMQLPWPLSFRAARNLSATSYISFAVSAPHVVPPVPPRAPAVTTPREYLQSDNSTDGSWILQIPNEMERKFDKFDKFDESDSLRPTIIHVGDCWDLSHQETLLSGHRRTKIKIKDQEKERNKAFDLLDALTKSGALTIDHAELHVIVASTYCFAKSIVQTVVQDNINPIEAGKFCPYSCLRHSPD